jgi:ATP-binding cassette, subfamily B, multidrug efflux pump
MSGLAIWLRMMKYMRPYWLLAMVAVVGLVGSNILIITIPKILEVVIDTGIIGRYPLLDATPMVMAEYIEDIGFEYGNADFMIAAGLLVVGLGVLRGVTGFMFRYFGERLSHYAAYDIRNEVYNHVQNLPFSYHDKAETGTIITRSISDVDEIQRFFAFGLIDGLNTLMLTIGISAVMLLSSPVLAVLAILPLIPLAFFSRSFALRIGPKWKKIMERMQRLGNHIQENSVGAEVVRAFSREDYEIQKFSEDNEHLYHERVDLITNWASYLPLSAFIISFSTALVLFFGGLMEQNDFGGVTVGMIVAFNAYVLLLSQPIRFLGFVILLITQAVSSAGRVFEILDAPMDIKSKPDARVLNRTRGYVRFDHVDFAYNGIEVLHDVSLEAHPGEVVALLGPTGAGKSSLVNLIPRFYDVKSGSVTIDGHDVRDVELSSLRKQIGMVLQSSLLFSATIRENIAYGDPDATEDEIIAAAKAANAYDFIQEFSNGFDTLVGERGVTLSGGQKQRVAIARALLVNPSVLILDDSTSSVDTRTEALIQDALNRLMRGRTTFIIAQRLNSIQNADQILVIQNGRITECGKHQDLLDRDGYYAEVYHLQLEDQERVRAELAALGYQPPETEVDRRLATDEFRAIIDRVGGK